MTAYVSLFRGINVGGNRKVSMNDLKDMHASLGLKDVSPYLQTGNVIFTTDNADVAQLRKQIEDSFENKFGFHVEVFIRTSPELQEIIAQNPFQNQPDKEAKWIVVLFLSTHPDLTAQENLRKAYLGPEELFFIGKEMYIYYPDGIGRSKLTLSLIEKKLKTFGTARNLNTVLQIHKLLQP